MQTMQGQGMDNPTMMQSLKERGYTPEQINDAMSQSQIKSAVSGDQATQGQMPQQTPEQNQEAAMASQASPSQGQFNQTPMGQPTNYPSMNPQQNQQPMAQEQPSTQEFSGMQPSMGPEGMAPTPGQPPMQGQGMDYQQQGGYDQGYGDQGQYQDQAYGYPTYPEQGSGGMGYDQYQYYPEQGNTDTMTEIAEQVVDARFDKIAKSIGNIAQFKTKVEGQVDYIEERLKKLEIIMEKLQASILGKVGEYGNHIRSINEEMRTMEDSFSKIVNPLLDKSRQHTENNPKTAKRKPSQKRKANKKSSKKKKTSISKPFTRIKA